MSTAAYCFAVPICWHSAIKARKEKSIQLVSSVAAMAWIAPMSSGAQPDSRAHHSDSSSPANSAARSRLSPNFPRRSRVKRAKAEVQASRGASKSTAERMSGLCCVESYSYTHYSK